jgi:hypothetical protein
MNSIQNQSNNLGGIAKIWLIPSRLIFSHLYDYPIGLLQLPVNWANDAWQITPVFQSASYTQDMQQSPSGTWWENTVSFKIPRYTLDNKPFAGTLSRLLWAVLTLDQNGEFLLVGSKDYPMRLSVKMTSGADLSELSHLAISVTGKSPILPLNIAITH